MTYEADLIRDTIAEPLAGLGLVVEEVRAHAAGRHRKVTVTVDLSTEPEQGEPLEEPAEPVGFDLVEQATRLVSELLDEIVIWKDGPYDLEVSSPGAERELTELRHFIRSLGRRVRVTSGEHSAVTEGRLAAVDPAASAVRVEVGDETVSVPLADVSKAKVLVSLN